MSDKILMEAFDKLKAIEESEDPFCIGAKDEPIEEANDPFCIGELSENEEDIADDDEEEIVEEVDEEVDEEVVEGVDDRTEPKVYEFATDDGDHYAIEFQDAGQGAERAFVEENGITIATYTVGGAGAMQPHIKDAGRILDALTFAMKAANGSGM